MTAPTAQPARPGSDGTAGPGDPTALMVAGTAERLIRLWAGRSELHHPGWGRPFRQLGDLLPEQDVEFAAHNPQMVPLLWYPALRHGSRTRPVIDVFDHLPAELGPALPRRQELSRVYSWALASRTALDWLTDCLDGRGLLEVGAGSGYWAWLLRARGVDVLATDAEARTERNGFTDRFQYTEVRPGRAAEDAAAHPDRVLALLWPPHRDPMAADTLRAYRGPSVLYLGDRPGGLCADPDFFTELTTHWRPLSRCPLTLRWLGNHDTATYFVRR
ncbi:class I SAM-dependent methyltransferase [Kitasatospora misakiensis]|uniref:Class I SAM-dependent methyltransferase n=1 Tax=Kitasatospora misakiensis TaxID=67330 RepID=A0ABW0X0I3_9ACTN